jgi:hypothetical protein
MAEPVDHEGWTDIQDLKSHIDIASALADKLEKEHGLTVFFGRQDTPGKAQSPTCRVIDSQGAIL